MIRENIDREWEFMNGKPSSMPGMAPPSKIVNLPHDFIIETDTFKEAQGKALTGYYGGGIGTYTKMIDVTDEYDGKRVLVEFDGSYMNTTVSLNGNLVTRHHYGYTPFHADLTPYLKKGKKNCLSVTVNSEAQPNGRWYSGAGIYRHVDLLTAGEVHIAPWGIYAVTSHIIDDTAFVVVETTVENHTSKVKDVWVNIKFTAQDGKVTGNGKVKVHALPNTKTIGRVQVVVEQADIWDIDSPKCYEISAELSDGESVLDTESTSFGIRTMSVDTKNGFQLNGRTIKLKGGCVHHDNGILGAVSLPDSEYRKMKIHKDNGYNAIRFAHNPMSRDLLDACDKLGLLVINEAFDVWTMEKNTHDYSMYFKENWQSDMEAFIVRDRNHPCVAIWSIGNEIPERGGLSDGHTWAAKLTDFVRSLDSSRFVTSSLCSFFNGLDDEDTAKFWQALREEMSSGLGNIMNLDNSFGKKIWGEYTESHAAPLDIVGYNYLNYHYEEAIEQFPNRVICCTESKALEMEEYWADVERFSHVIGDFTWTSHDYLGEAGIGKQLHVEPEEAASAAQRLHVAEFPWRTSNDADFDLCGFARPQSAFRKIIWGSNETFITSFNPAFHDLVEVIGRFAWYDCEHSWTWPGEEGKAVKVEVYSAADEVELLLNGSIVGRQKAGKENLFKATFEMIYEPGTLEAVSYTDGKKVSEDSLKSAGEAVGIRIKADKTVITADGQSLCFAVVEAIDKDGNFVPTVEKLTTASVTGVATLAAFGTGNPITDENYTKGEFTSYKGRLLAIVRAGYETGIATLNVNMESVGKTSVDITVQ